LLLTEYGHLDPVVSNVISLVLMTVARFIVADTIIWQERTRPSTTRSVPVGEL
jgi:putative flippase GtrA